MKIAILDTETTGFDGQVIELAWLEVDINFPDFIISQKTELLEQDFYFKPTVPIQYGAKATHHILESELVDYPLVGSDAYEQLIEYLNEFDYLIGHNIDFDCKVAKIDKPKRIDTLAIARKILSDECDSRTQTALMYFFFGDTAKPIVQNAHNALADVKMCASLLGKLVSYYYHGYKPEELKSQISSYDDLYNFSEWCRIPDKLHFGKHRGKTYKEVAKDDPGYFTWWKTKSDTPPNDYELKAITWAFEK